MQSTILTLLLSLVTISGCTESYEPQSVLVRFNVQTLDGLSHSYDKVIPFKTILDTFPFGPYECKVELDNSIYRMAFWANLYPPISLPSVDIRYSFGNTEGTGLVMSQKYFSIHDTHSSMSMEMYRTQWLDLLRKEYSNQYKDNLDCQILTF